VCEQQAHLGNLGLGVHAALAAVWEHAGADVSMDDVATFIEAIEEHGYEVRAIPRARRDQMARQR
jgi:hypothetical protein